MENRLPTKFSDLLELALKDLERAERSTVVRINMNDWLANNNLTGICEACLAGSVMKFSLDADSLGLYRVGPDVMYERDKITLADRNRLLAIDALRRGDIAIAYDRISRDRPIGVRSYWPVRAYHPGTDYFKFDLRDIIAHLRNFGE